jgi:hypothetical protein
MTAYGCGPPARIERFAEHRRLVTESHLLLDPLYGMMRRDRVVRLPDPSCSSRTRSSPPGLRWPARSGTSPGSLLPSLQAVFAAGGYRPPAWRFALAGQPGGPPCSAGKLVAVREADLRPGERRQASAAVVRMFLRRKRVTATHRGRKVAGLVSHALARPPGLASTSPKAVEEILVPCMGRCSCTEQGSQSRPGPTAGLRASSAPPQLLFSAA